MAEGVVPDGVAGLGNLTDDLGKLLYVTADEKKSCVDFVLGQKFEQVLRVRIVRAIVEGESKLGRGRGGADECSSVPLAGG